MVFKWTQVSNLVHYNMGSSWVTGKKIEISNSLGLSCAAKKGVLQVEHWLMHCMLPTTVHGVAHTTGWAAAWVQTTHAPASRAHKIIHPEKLSCCFPPKTFFSANFARNVEKKLNWEWLFEAQKKPHYFVDQINDLFSGCPNLSSR